MGLPGLLWAKHARFHFLSKLMRILRSDLAALLLAVPLFVGSPASRAFCESRKRVRRAGAAARAMQGGLSIALFYLLTASQVKSS